MGNRVIEVQRHTRWALVLAGLFAVASPVAAVIPHDTGRWLPLHLFLVGSLLCAISGATQMLAVTWSTAPAPTDAVAGVQLALMALGAVGVALGREVDSYALVGIGASASGVGLITLVGILAWVRRWSATDRFHPAIDGYVVAAGWGAVGITLGALVAHGGDTYTPRLIEAHLAVNLFGLVGLVILATLPYFAATQLRVKMSRLATSIRLRAVILWTSVVVALVLVGELLDARWLVSAGLLGVGLAVVYTAWLSPRPKRRQFDWAGPRLVGVVAGLIWWVICAVVLAVQADGVTLSSSTALPALAAGAYAQILGASLAYLGPVVRAGGHERLGAGFTLMKSWPGVAAANVGAALLLFGAYSAAWVVLALWALDTAVRGALLLRPAAR